MITRNTILHTFRRRCAAFLAALCALSAGCCMPGDKSSPGDKTGPQELRIATWNTQALFDGEDRGNEYDEYRADTGWNAEKYQARLQGIGRGVGIIAKGGPDILALIEIENDGVLRDLSTGPLRQYGYRYSCFTSLPGYSLGIGVLSRYPLSGERSHSITVRGETAPRPVLEVRVRPRPAAAGSDELFLLICHWKSKLGGAENTEALRRASARVLRRRLDEIAREAPQAQVLILGDLNENHDEFYRQGGAMLSALLPDDPQASRMASLQGDQDYLIITKQKPPRTRCFAPGTLALYSPWETEMSGGSFSYKNAWETIDHFLLSDTCFNGQGWDFENCVVINGEPLATSKGQPAAYNPRTGNGYSDHFPLLLTLKAY